MAKVQPTREHDVTAPLRRSLVLKGHTDHLQVWCLTALDGGRLASGSGDTSIIIWSVAEEKQVAKLEGHTESVRCLTALPDGRLASGSGDSSIRIWSVADEKQLAKLEGHTGWVNCLAALDGGRLASGSSDESIIIWSVADEKQLAKLEGHTDTVWCLTALPDGRLASGSKDNSIIIWSLADGKQLAKLEGHTGWVNCLAALDGGRLASGSDDMTIRVRPVDKLCIIAACGSAFEFEEAARGCEQDSLGDLFDAAIVQFNENMGVSSSTAITMQAHVFDAIAKVVNEGEDQKESIDSLAQSVLVLVRDDDLLLDMERRGVSDTALQELAPSPLFRVVLDAKFSAGPVFVLYFELLLFIVLGGCFARVAAFEVLGESKWGKWFAL